MVGRGYLVLAGVLAVGGCETKMPAWWEVQEVAAYDTQATLEAATIKQKRINEAFVARVNASLEKKEK